MTLIERFNKINFLKFAFAKSSEYSKAFAREINAYSMYDKGYGLSIPTNLSSENQLRGVFKEVIRQNGVFLFNLSGVDLNKARKGFANFEEAENNNQITEWELYIILSNTDYFKSTIFHNGKVQFKKRLIWKSIIS